MNKFIVLAAVIAVVAGEAPPHVGLSGYSRGGNGGSGGSGINEYVDEALLARVGELIARGGDGSGTPQGTEGLNLDSEILTRVSGSLGDGGSSGPSTAYGPPSRSPSLGQPEPATRIAEFELSDSSAAAPGGGYDSAPAPAPEYGAPAPSFNRQSSKSSKSISLGLPMVAKRVSDFAVSGDSGSNGGYN